MVTTFGFFSKEPLGAVRTAWERRKAQEREAKEAVKRTRKT